MPGGSPGGSRWVAPALALASLVGLLVYFRLVELSPWGALRAVAGMAALWGPAALLLWLLLRREVERRVVLLALSLTGSYALTTLAFFVCSVLRARPLFYALQAGLTVGCVALLVRRGGLRDAVRRLRDWRAADWWLVLMIVVSLLVVSRFQHPYAVDAATGARKVQLYMDYTYHASMTHELERGIPPRQMSIAAGLKERAYHLFPHVTSLLLARFCGEEDMLRAWVVHHLAAATVLLCLAIHAIMLLVTGARGAGYAGIALLYALNVPVPPIVPNLQGHFYFTLHPFYSSALEPTLLTSPQTYSALVVHFGLFLAVAQASSRLRSGLRAGRLAVVAGLVAGALLKFRVQIFLPLAPAFLLLAALAWRRTRDWRAPAAAVAALAATVIFIVVEMRSQEYRGGTDELQLGYNNLTDEVQYENKVFFVAWPMASKVHDAIYGALGEGRAARWAWQVACLAAFALLNIVGVVMAALCALFLAGRGAWREWRPVSLFALLLSAGAVAGASALKTGYDSYSVGGQMLLLVCWYLFPLMVAGLWRAWLALRLRLRPGAAYLSIGGLALVAGGLAWQLARKPTQFEEQLRDRDAIVASGQEWEALGWIRERTPPDAVVLTSEHLRWALAGAVGARATLLEYMDAYVIEEPELIWRSGFVSKVYNPANLGVFCRLMETTPVTHMIIKKSPYGLQAPPDCMKVAWEGGAAGDRVAVWEVRR